MHQDFVAGISPPRLPLFTGIIQQCPTGWPHHMPHDFHNMMNTFGNNSTTYAKLQKTKVFFERKVWNFLICSSHVKSKVFGIHPIHKSPIKITSTNTPVGTKSLVSSWCTPYSIYFPLVTGKKCWKQLVVWSIHLSGDMWRFSQAAWRHKMSGPTCWICWRSKVCRCGHSVWEPWELR